MKNVVALLLSTACLAACGTQQVMTSSAPMPIKATVRSAAGIRVVKPNAASFSPVRDAMQDKQAQAGTALEGVQFVDQLGKLHTLGEFRGKPIVLTAFATWCAKSRKRVPDIERKLYAKYKAKGVEFLTIAVDGDTPAQLREFAEFGQVNRLPLFLDHNGSVRQALPVLGFPKTFFVDKQLSVVDEIEGWSPGGSMPDMIGMILDSQLGSRR
jgi:peroxiredoxin